MGTDRTRTTEPRYEDAPETPKGIWVIAFVGLIGSVLSILAGATGLMAGAIVFPAGIGLILLGFAQGITMLALMGLTPWAWYATIVLYLIAAVIELLQGDGIATVLSLFIVAYVGVHRDLFEE